MAHNQNLQRYIAYLIYFLPAALITGPFLSDLIVSIVAIYFIYISFRYRLFQYYQNIFFLFFVFFYLFILIRSIFSIDPQLSLESSLFYFRFIFFIMTISYLMDVNNRFLRNFFYSLLITLSLLVSDTYLQFFSGSNIFGWPILALGDQFRVSSFFYDEYILGNYLVSFIPILLGVYFLVGDIRFGKYIFLLILFSSIAVLLSGDRSSIFLNILSIFLMVILIRSYRSYRYGLLIFFILSISFTLLVSEKIQERVVTTTYNEIGIGNDTQYIFSPLHDAFIKSSFYMMQEKPIFGHGPKLYRVLCKDKKYVRSGFKRQDICSTHPHNTYMQLMVETGIIGTSFVIAFFFYILWKLMLTMYFKLKKIEIDKKDEFRLDGEICFMIGIFLCLWPILPTLNFFNNWASIIYFFPIGFIFSKFSLRNKRNA